MSGFFIRRIAASGPEVKESEIVFERGVNIIYGQSNTGKSVAVMCLKFMFSSKDVPQIVLASGYETISMTLENEKGETLVVNRAMVMTDKGPKGDSSMDVISSIEDIPSGRYSNDHNAKKNYNDVLLKLLGISESFKIIGAKNRTGKALTVKGFSHQFLLDKGRIGQTESILINPGENFSNETYNLNAFIYLLTGEHEEPTEEETPNRKEIKKKAVIEYIRQSRNVLAERKQELQDELLLIGDVDPDEQIESLLHEIDSLQASADQENEKARSIQGELYRLSQSLEEERIQKERLARLGSLYEADIKRLNFILDGERKLPTGTLETCPFCEQELTAAAPQEQRYFEATKAERDKTRQRLYDLVDTETALDESMQEAAAKIESLKRDRAECVNAIQKTYVPKIERLREVIASCEKVIQLRQDLETQTQTLDAIDKDLKDYQDRETRVAEFDAKAFMDAKLFDQLSAQISDAVKQCEYPGFQSARVSRNTFDVLVNGKPKTMEGEGYQSFLNSIYAFTLMKFLEDYGEHPIRMLLLESPILPLKESEGKQVTSSMKSALFKYLIEECADSQLIIIENELPENVDYSSANLVHFTGDPNVGRAGFLAEVHDFNEDPDAELVWREYNEDE